jgi:hypothetical protein
MKVEVHQRSIRGVYVLLVFMSECFWPLPHPVFLKYFYSELDILRPQAFQSLDKVIPISGLTATISLNKNKWSSRKAKAAHKNYLSAVIFLVVAWAWYQSRWTIFRVDLGVGNTSFAIFNFMITFKPIMNRVGLWFLFYPGLWNCSHEKGK